MPHQPHDDDIDIRAERPLGWLAGFASAVAAWRAVPAAPVHQPLVTVPGDIAELCAEIRAASGRDVAGPRLTTVRTGDGYEYRGPLTAVQWADAAGLDADMAALAWTLSSEAPSIARYPQYSVAIGEAVLSAAAAAGRSVVAQVTRDARHQVANGYYGRQPGRWCSTFQPPTHRHLVCAQRLIESRRAKAQPLISGAAVRWLDPHTQTRLAKRPGAMTMEPELVVTKWARDGYEWIGPTVDEQGNHVLDPFVLLLFRRARPWGAPPSTAATLAALADGRRRWRL